MCVTLITMKRRVLLYFAFVGICIANGQCPQSDWSKFYARTGAATILRFTVSVPTPKPAVLQIVSSYNNTILLTVLYTESRSSILLLKEGYTFVGNISNGELYLEITDLKQTDAKLYTVVQSASGNISTVKCATLYILGVPTTPTVTIDKNPSVEESMTLTCSSTSTTTPSNHSLSLVYSWRLDGVDNPSGPRYNYSTSRNTLTLSSVVKEDARKQFSCYAKEDIEDGYTSTTSTVASVTIIYGPENLTFSPGKNRYEHEENVELPPIICQAECVPACSYQWTKRDTGIFISKLNTLQLGRLERAEAGTYRCTATRSDLVSSFLELSVFVMYSPVVSVRFSTKERAEGTNLTLFCIGEGVPATYIYTGLTQTAGQVELPNTNTALQGTATYGSIHFPSLQLEDTGNYTCKLNNGISDINGTLDQTYTVELLVEVKPKVLTNDLIFAGKLGEGLKVQVPFYCYPAVTSLTFVRFDGVVMDRRSHVESIVHGIFYGRNVALNGYEALMTIPNLREEDFASYTLTIQNMRGTTSVRVYVNAESIPNIPKRFEYQLLPTGPSFIWEKGFNGGHTQTFLIQVSIIGSGKWKNFIIVSEDDETFKVNDSFYNVNITGLEAGVYAARLTAKNIIGETDPFNLNSTWVIASEMGAQGELTSNTAAIAFGVSAFIMFLAFVVVLGFVLVRRGIISRGCKKDISGSSTQNETAGCENSYYNLESDNRNTYDELIKADKGPVYSELRMSECRTDASTYEMLQGSDEENRKHTNKSLYPDNTARASSSRIQSSKGNRGDQI